MNTPFPRVLFAARRERLKLSSAEDARPPQPHRSCPAVPQLAAPLGAKVQRRLSAPPPDCLSLGALPSRRLPMGSRRRQSLGSRAGVQQSGQPPSAGGGRDGGGWSDVALSGGEGGASGQGRLSGLLNVCREPVPDCGLTARSLPPGLRHVNWQAHSFAVVKGMMDFAGRFNRTLVLYLFHLYFTHRYGHRGPNKGA